MFFSKYVQLTANEFSFGWFLGTSNPSLPDKDANSFHHAVLAIGVRVRRRAGEVAPWQCVAGHWRRRGERVIHPACRAVFAVFDSTRGWLVGDRDHKREVSDSGTNQPTNSMHEPRGACAPGNLPSYCAELRICGVFAS
jgi:hypothetical protein